MEFFSSCYNFDIHIDKKNDKNIIILSKLEVTKFILVMNNKIIKNYLYNKKINIDKYVNYFINLGYDNHEKEILLQNRNNKYFNYNDIKNNRVFTFILKMFFYKNKKNVFFKKLNNINNVYKMILKKNLIDVKVSYDSIINFYEYIYGEKIYISNLNVLRINIPYEDKSIYFFGNNQKDINNEKKEMIKEKKLTQKFLKDKEILTALNNNISEMYEINEYVKQHILTPDENVDKTLLKKINFLEKKIL